MRRLEAELRARGISQSELARMTGINRVSINRMLHGKEVPWPKWRVAIADAIDWPVDRAAELFEEMM